MTTEAKPKDEKPSTEEEGEPEKRTVGRPKGARNVLATHKNAGPTWSKNRPQPTGLDPKTYKAMATDYIAHEMTIAKLAIKYKMSPASVSKLHKYYKWDLKRKNFVHKMIEWTVDSTAERFQYISGEVSKVFFKQMKYVKRRLSLVPDGDPVPKDLMLEAIQLHDLIQKDLIKIDKNEKFKGNHRVSVDFGKMPGIIDLLNYKPEQIEKPQGQLVAPENKEEEKKIEKPTPDLPEVNVGSDPLTGEDVG